MKKFIPFILLSFLLHGFTPAFAGDIWQLAFSRPVANAVQPAIGYLTYRVDESALRLSLSAAAKNTSGRIVDLPMPDGTFRSFSVASTPMLPPGLAAKYPEINTYTAYCLGNQFITAKLDFTVYGFHAMVYDGNKTSFINPLGGLEGYYAVYYKKDEIRKEGKACRTNGPNHASAVNTTGTASGVTAGTQKKVINGYELRKYRLALACSHQYAQVVTGVASPTVAQVLSKMTTTMNRVNGIYEREVSITMTFVEKEDTLIFPDEAGDPYGPSNFSIGAMLNKNQYVCDSLIGDANYDMGHAFCTSNEGGLSSLGIICQSGLKAESATGSDTPYGDGFDVDYLSHEMGHEYGADHTFNMNTGVGCGGNAVALQAFEPGSGSTIMAYAGLCSPENLQAHSDAYFHATSLQQIQHYLITDGDECAIKMPTGNKLPGIAPYTASYSIPFQTPFELMGPIATDSIGDGQFSYCWEQWNRGDFGKNLANTSVAGPLFRSFTPVGTPLRIFPNIKMVLNGVLSNAGIDKASGEKTPDAARYMTFKMAARKVHNGYGCFTLPDDSIHLNVINTGSGFRVTSQNTSGITLDGSDAEVVTWDVVGTNTAPINAATVDIYMSADSGYTWPYFLGNFPNTGSAAVILPNPDTLIPAARIKVKGGNNVFFNINSRDFQVRRNVESSIKIYPVPAHSVLHIVADKTGILQTVVFNMLGQVVWRDDIDISADLPSYLWARGVYIVKLIDPTGRTVIRKVVID